MAEKVFLRTGKRRSRWRKRAADGNSAPGLLLCRDYGNYNESYRAHKRAQARAHRNNFFARVFWHQGLIAHLQILDLISACSTGAQLDFFVFLRIGLVGKGGKPISSQASRRQLSRLRRSPLYRCAASMMGTKDSRARMGMSALKLHLKLRIQLSSNPIDYVAKEPLRNAT